jgi:hypothetical protein
MRYQNIDAINLERLEIMVNKFSSPKTLRALKTFRETLSERLSPNLSTALV